MAEATGGEKDAAQSASPFGVGIDFILGILLGLGMVALTGVVYFLLTLIPQLAFTAAHNTFVFFLSILGAVLAVFLALFRRHLRIFMVALVVSILLAFALLPKS